MKSRIGLIAGMYITTFLVCILIVSSIVWLVGWHITPIVLPLALIIALVVFAIMKTSRMEQIIALALSIGIILLSTLIETFVYDVSYDGNAYHQPIIYALANGWNPIYEHHNDVISDTWKMNIWIDHYCKGAETIASAFLAVTGNIESGKAVNLLIPTALFLILYDFFKERFVIQFSTKKSLLYSLGIAFSMVVVGQITSYYIDYIGYFIFVLALLGVYDIVETRGNEKEGYWMLVCSIMIASSVKFNMLFWTGYVVACSLIVMLVRKNYHKALRLALVSASVAIISVVVLSYNPFVTNTMDHANPFYPLFEKNILSGDSPARNAQPPYMRNAPRYKQVFLSYFQRPSNDMKSTAYIPPYRISKTNIYRSGYCCTNVGGGGLFFIEILLATFLVFAFFRKGKYYKQFCIAAIALIATLFILPIGSNFRYVPFIYLLPFLGLLYLETCEKQTSFSQVMNYILSCLLVLNISLCAVITMATNYIEQKETIQTVKMLEGKGGESFYTMNWGFCNKLYHGKMNGKEPISPLLPEDQYERDKFIGGPFVYLLKK